MEDHSKVNLIELWTPDLVDTCLALDLVRLDSNQTAVIPFTSDGTQVAIHYCDQGDSPGYVHCNGPDCVLCRAGRKPDERVLLPVYLPAIQRVGVLAISPATAPGTLRPP